MRWFERRRRRGEIDESLPETEGLFLPAEHTVGAHHGAGHGERQIVILERMAARSERGLKRADNQDRVLVEDLPTGAILAAVADGVGGTGGGEVASSAAVQVLPSQLLQGTDSDSAVALERVFSAANQSVRAQAAERPELEGMGTTLVAALVHDDLAWIASVGDSRAYLFHQGKLRQLTQDHTWVAEQIGAGRFIEDEGRKSDFRNIITRAIGAAETVKPDKIGPVTLPADSFLLLCSDGLHGVVSDLEIAAILESGSPTRMVERLISLANRAGGPDNISAVIVRGLPSH